MRSEALARVQQGLNAGRLVAEQNLHLTLGFLDEVPEAELTELHDGLSALHEPAPKLQVRGLDVFGGSRPRLLYARVEADEALKALRGKVLREIRAAGIELKRERFRPHITLARFRYGMMPDEQAKLGRFLQEVGNASLPAFYPAGFGLYASSLRPDGAVHELLAAYPLIGGGEA